MDNVEESKCSDQQKLLPLSLQQRLPYGDDQEQLSNSTSTTIEKTKADYISYRKRWYILGVFFTSAFAQLTLWNTFGPIANTAQAVYGFSNSDIALLAAWGAFTQALAGPVFAWFMDVKGLRISVIISNGLLFLGTALRCIPLSLSNTKWAMHIGQIVLGFSGPVMMSGAPLLSANWFPVHQTTTSTAIGTSASYFGVAFSYLIGPAIVSEVKMKNSSDCTLNNTQGINSFDHNEYRKEINNLMYIECAWTAALLLIVLAYFPAKPPTPPRPSAEKKREPFISGAKKLISSSQFWFVAVAYGVSSGVFLGWSSQTILIFEETLDVKQSVSSSIGLYSSIAGAIGAILFGWFVDRFGSKMKTIILAQTLCAVVSSVWILLLCEEVISFNKESLYISNILYGFFVNAAVPIYFEMTVKGTFPVAEGITTCCLIIMNSTSCSIILIIMLFPDISVSSLNYAAIGSVAVGIPLLLLYKEEDNRDKEDVQ